MSSPPLAAGVDAAVSEAAVGAGAAALVLGPAPKLNPVTGANEEVEPADPNDEPPNENPGLRPPTAPFKSFLTPVNAAPKPNDGGDPLPNPVAIGGEACGLERPPTLMGVDVAEPNPKPPDPVVENPPKEFDGAEAVDVAEIGLKLKAAAGAVGADAVSDFFASSFPLAVSPFAILPKVAPNENGGGRGLASWPSSAFFLSSIATGGGETLSPKRRGLGAAGAFCSLDTFFAVGAVAGVFTGAAGVDAGAADEAGGAGADGDEDGVAATGNEKALFSR